MGLEIVNQIIPRYARLGRYGMVDYVSLTRGSTTIYYNKMKDDRLISIKSYCCTLRTRENRKYLNVVFFKEISKYFNIFN